MNPDKDGDSISKSSVVPVPSVPPANNLFLLT